MDDGHGRASTAAVILVGAIYALIGVVFAWPATHVRTWRVAAWLVSAGVYAAHIVYECFSIRHAARRAAVLVAIAVALGAFGLALAANIHSLGVVSTGQHRRLLLVALVIWPVMTGVPAFLVALVASEVLARSPWRRRD